MASELANPFSASKSNTEGLGSSVGPGDEIVSSLGSSSRSQPQFPCHLFPYYQGNKQYIQKSLLLASPGYPPWHAPWSLSKPRVETQAALGHSLLQLHQQQHQMLSQLSGTQPHPHSSSRGVEGTWETQISTEEFGTDRNFPVACFPGSPSRDREGKGIVNTSWTFFQRSNILAPTPQLCPLFYKGLGLKTLVLLDAFC